jgi:FKBP-type peptidyl-prolyl cis-trans isomerase
MTPSRVTGRPFATSRVRNALPSRNSRKSVCCHATKAREPLPEKRDVVVRSSHAVSRRAALAASLTVGFFQSFARPDAAVAIEEGPRTDMPMAEEGTTTLVGIEEAGKTLSPTAKQILALNKRVQAQNRAPRDFPAFVREGFDVKVLGDGYQTTSDGLIYKDFEKGSGSPPTLNNEVIFNYTGYNESGKEIDSSFRQGKPAQIQLGVKGLIPGFELGISTMKAGGTRRFIVPPELGPPVGPSTFFSAKQCEVFDVELLDIRLCERTQQGMFSRVVCT